MSIWSTCTGRYAMEIGSGFSLRKWLIENWDEFTVKIEQDRSDLILIKFEISFSMDGIEAAKMTESLYRVLRENTVWRELSCDIRWC